MSTKEDFEFYVQQLENIQQNLGYGVMLFFLLLIVILFFTSIYLKRVIERSAEEASEKTLKKYQAELDRENFKYQTMYQNQINAIHKVFKEFNQLNIAINFLLNGENFSSPPSSRELINHIIELRHSFKKEFLGNKLLFSKDLKTKIESLVPEVDRFIETFSSGLFPEMSPEHQEMNAELNGGYVIEGIWGVGTFEPLIKKMDLISSDIEDEFRKIVGIK